MSIIEKHKIKTEKKDSEVSITGELATETLQNYEKEALQFFSENLKIDGFRPGNIPENIVRKNVPETAILEETASRALNAIYPEIIREEKLDVFGRPQVHFTKLAPGNPVEFSIQTALAPKVEIADYKKIAKDLNAKKEEIEVTEEEVNNALLEVRRELDRREEASTPSEESTTESSTEENQVDSKKKSGDKPEEAEPSPLTDEKVQTISPVKTVDEFTDLVRKDLIVHKQNQAAEKHRLELVEAVLEKSKISVPNLVIESELQSMMAQFAHDVTQAGIKMEDYLKQAGKTEEELLKEWRPHAENRAKMQLILNKIAIDEELLPEEKTLEEQVENILKHNPSVSREQALVYVETQLANANVFTFLEEQ